MKAAAFAYVRADSVAHAVELLAADPDDTRVLAGGQSLGPMLNLRLARPSTLIDIKRVASLRELDADDRTLRLGACWTHAEIEDGVVEDPTCGLLPSVARGIAYRAVRNRGTIGGSLAHADPAADWVNAMAVLGADVIVHGPGNTVRRCGADAFMRAGFATDLQRGEMIGAIEVPRLSTRRGGVIIKFAASAASSRLPLGQRCSMPRLGSRAWCAVRPQVRRCCCRPLPLGLRKLDRTRPWR